MKKLFYLFLFLPLQDVVSQLDTASYCIAFYNVENLFHPTKDSLTQDDAFTPEGLNHWTYKKYFQKINNTAKVLLAMGKGSPPDIIGLEEIENDKTLKDLCYRSPLKKFTYQYVHYESPDNRGIDVALLYRSDRVSILHSTPIHIVFPFEPLSKNRDILYVTAQLPTRDTLHIFVNHWTSRYGGLAATIPKRNHYATVLRQKTDSILKQNKNAYIIIGGDFNDYPSDESLKIILETQIPGKSPKASHLFNLMLAFPALQNIGTHKHEDFWGCLDQIIVSESLLSKTASLQIENNKAEIFIEDFMMEPDTKYGGQKPFRTYLGPRYIGGYADHLPVFVRLIPKH